MRRGKSLLSEGKGGLKALKLGGFHWGFFGHIIPDMHRDNTSSE
ncbi:hypothetical protein [Roseivirga sp.]